MSHIDILDSLDLGNRIYTRMQGLSREYISVITAAVL